MGLEKYSAFAGTKEQETALLQVIADHKDDKVLLCPYYKSAGIYGYLPIEVQTIISDELKVPLGKYTELLHFTHNSP